MSEVCVIPIDDPTAALSGADKVQKAPIKTNIYRKSATFVAKTKPRFAEKRRFFEACHLMLQLKQGTQDLWGNLPKWQHSASLDSLVSNTSATDSSSSEDSAGGNSGGCVRWTRHTFWIFALGMIAFIMLGGLAFSSLEAGHEMNERRVFRDFRQKFLEKHVGLTDADLEDFIEVISGLSGRGVNALLNATAPANNWDWGQSFFFAGSLVTTIGYGSVTPLTSDGRLFCVLYALVGIPLMLVLISTLVNRLKVLTDRLLAWMLAHEVVQDWRFSVRFAHLMVFVVLFLYLFIMMPTILLVHLEPTWTKVDALFYCFVTMATIGQGEIIPGDQPMQEYRGLYKVLITVYLMCGLCAVMLCVDIYNDMPELSLGQLLREAEAEAEDEVQQTTPKPAGHHEIPCET